MTPPVALALFTGPLFYVTVLGTSQWSLEFAKQHHLLNSKYFHVHRTL